MIKRLVIIFFLLFASRCFAATEFVCTINKTGEDYNTLSLWEAALDDAGNITDGTVKTGNWDNKVGSTIADATTVGWDAGETGTATSYVSNTLINSGSSFLTSGVTVGDLVMNTTDNTTATVVSVDSDTQLTLSADIFPDGNENYEIYWSYGKLIHITATQYLIDILNGTLADNDTVIDISNNSFDIAGTPDSSIIVAECYDDDGPLDDTVTIGGFTTSAANYVKITVPVGERHNGTLPSGSAGGGFLLKHDFNGTDNSAIVSINGGIANVVEWVAVRMELTGDSSGNIAINVDSPASSEITNIRNCIVSVGTISANDTATTGIKLREGSSGDSTHNVYNNIVYGFKGSSANNCRGIYVSTSSFRTIYANLFNNTIYGCDNGIYADTSGTSSIWNIVARNNIFNDCSIDVNLNLTNSPTVNIGNSRANITDNTPSATFAFGVVADSGTTDGVAANKLIQSGQNFLTTVVVGQIIKNTTDTNYTYVTAVDSDTQLSINDDIMANGENYTIYINMYGSVTFVNETAGSENLHLGSTDTVAIDKGTDLGNGAWDTDIDGRDRDTEDDTWDIGADEYVFLPPRGLYFKITANRRTEWNGISSSRKFVRCRR